jgi:two-component system chemotaxis sensor kinase CheA
MAHDPYKYFRVEARELLEQIGQGVLDLEKGAKTPDLIPRMLRLAHTLKGAARVVKQREIADQAHAIEDALATLRDSPAGASRAHVETVLKLVDKIGAGVASLAPPGDGARSAPDRALPEEALRTVRTDIEEMDALLDGISEAHTGMGVLQKDLSSLDHAWYLVDILVEQETRRQRETAHRAAGVARGHSAAEELRATVGGVRGSLASSLERMDRELRRVRDSAEQLRLVPAGALFTSLERIARDAAQAQSKRVIFEGRGGDVRLDAHVLGVVQGALLQLVRNAVAHGVEPEAERRKAGKPAEGRVTLDVVRRGRRVAFHCKDDGRGVDVEAVRRAAQRKGMAAEIGELGVEEVLELLLQGGISTSSAVDGVSGRGIGLDVVREAAERLGGMVNVRTEAGKGTNVELTVPLSLASLAALLVESDGRTAAVPLDALTGTLRVTPEQLAKTAQGETIVYENRPIPFLRLSVLLSPRGTGNPRVGKPWSAVIVRGAAGIAAIGVERLSGTANIVLRPLPELAPATPAVAGGFLDPEGNFQLVLDADGLIQEAQRGRAAQEEMALPRRPILIIDDSLTTRMLEQSILESAGYEADLATSGEEALEKARRKRYALFLVDVEMPGMDGFSFIEKARNDPNLRDVPSILVTSRTSLEDRRRGQDVGARGYIAKSEFEQAELLDRIRRLVS